MTRWLRWLAPWLLGAPLTAIAGDAGAPFLWQVKTGSAHHWLLGSVHLLPAAAYPLPAALDRAYAESQSLVLESDIGALATPEVQLQIMSAARTEDDGGLKAQVPGALYEQLRQRASALDMPMALCDAFKPWFCALTLEVFIFTHAGFDASLGIDQHYYAQALEDGKTLRWLEPVDEHVALFTQMSPELSTQFLAATVEEQDPTAQDPQELLRIWRENDAAALDQAALELRSKHPRAYERLLAARNKTWSTRLAPIFAEAAPQLVIVGAAHLSGPDGLVSLLRQRGYVVEPASAVVEAPATPTPAPEAPAGTLSD